MVYVLGGWQSDFSRNWAREGMEVSDGFAEALNHGLDAAKLDPTEIEVGHVGNFVGELFCHQGMMGGLFAQTDRRFDGMPTARHEAACASGSLAIMAAMADIEAGRYDVACAIGLEMMRNVPGKLAAEHLGAAAWHGHEFQDAAYVWPRAFSDVGDVYQERFGIKREHLAEIARINFGNAKRNPNAQTRGWAFTDASFTDDDEANPVIEGNIRRQDCGQVTDGAAVVFLASERKAAEYARKHGLRLEDLPRIKGWGHTGAPMSLRSKLEVQDEEGWIFPHVKKAGEDARRRAGIADVWGIDAVETHDCFTTTEYMAIEHLGLTKAGEAWKAIEDGTIDFDGKLPFNPSGGLIGLGHPVGATGVRMVLDAAKQVTGTAGDYQVEGAKNVQTLNIGGSTTTTVSFVVGT
ncbi:acetyl-CoA acetyltransferase [uncultured Brevundimonas sp.]|uniref:acetyl-CoA acetyltransferase n=1 Tax=uncultured Brevundimonas sp. TaxID=213418 RepID=UPI002624C8EC|nr:acetyl-CoA acetyltransferase [uncultured Brevundimonas sp.]